MRFQTNIGFANCKFEEIGRDMFKKKQGEIIVLCRFAA